MKKLGEEERKRRRKESYRKCRVARKERMTEEEKEKRRAYDRKYYRAYCEKNSDMIREKKRKWDSDHREQKHIYYLNHIEERKAYNKKWYQDHKMETAIASKMWRASHPDHRRERTLSQYGLSLEEYDDILETQSGGCKICGVLEVGKRTFHVDHDHKTGKNRGLLCKHCNVMLAMARDNKDILFRAIDYLLENEE